MEKREQLIKELGQFKGLTPFRFQEKAYVDCMLFLDEGDNRKSGVAVLPTAWGKSLLVSWLSLSMTKRGKKVLMIVPSIDLLSQNLKKLEYYGADVGVYSGSLLKKETSKTITLATVQSLKDKSNDFMDVDVVIVDEAHYKFPAKEGGVFNEFISEVNPSKLLGLTATPFSLHSGKKFSYLQMLHKEETPLFDNIVHCTQISEIIKEGRWSKIQYETVPYEMNGLQLSSKGNSYTDKSIQEVNKKNNVNNKAYKLVKDIINQKDTKTLLFVESVSVALKMREVLQAKCGRRVEVIVSDTKKKDRKEILETFTNTKDIACIVNVGVLTTGLDVPDLTHICVAFPTNSLALYYQIVGRGVRVAEGKEFFVFIDLCGNIPKFGKVETLHFDKVGTFGWGLFNDSNRLLTSVPLDSTRKWFKKDLFSFKSVPKPDVNYKIPFGKYKGRPLKALPMWYIKAQLEMMVHDTYRNEKREEYYTLLSSLLLWEESQLFSN